MSLTNFQIGAWNVIGGLGFGMAQSSKVLFVDKNNGGDTNPGTSPEEALKTIERALVVAGPYDVIYVADPGTSSSDPSTYSGASANYTIPYTSKGLALVGISHSSVLCNGRPMAPSLYAYQAATPLITVNAAQVTIEGFRLCGVWDAGGVETAGIAAPDFSEGVAEGFGLSVHNCYFEDINSVGDLGAVAITGQWNGTITNCTFMNCEIGISIVSSSSTIVGTVIDKVKFLSRDGDGSEIKCDIYIYAQGATGIMINDVFIGHDAPTASGNKGASIVAAAGTEDGLISNVYMLDANGTAHATTGTCIRVPTTMGVCNVHNGDNVLIDVN